MELQQFITTVIKAIGKGIQGGKEGNIKSGDPLIGKDYGKGVEFDLCIDIQEGKIHVKDSFAQNVNLTSRIKFSLPITTE